MPLSGKPTHHYRRRGSKSIEAAQSTSTRPVQDMKKEFLSKLQRQNASLLTSSVEEEEDDESQIPDLTILDPTMMGILISFYAFEIMRSFKISFLII